MSTKTQNKFDQDLLAIQLQPSHVSVSYLSSLLRLVQAALREVARSEDDTRTYFDQNPQPVLQLSRLQTGSALTMYFSFIESGTGAPFSELSAQIFGGLLDRFSKFVQGLPQPGLWGGPANRPSQYPFEDNLTKRMDQLYRELRRSPKATLIAQGRTIEIEGDRLEIG